MFNNLTEQIKVMSFLIDIIKEAMQNTKAAKGTLSLQLKYTEYHRCDIWISHSAGKI